MNALAVWFVRSCSYQTVTSRCGGVRISQPQPSDVTARGAEAGASAPRSWRLENFVPIRKADLLAVLSSDPGLREAERTDFLRLCRLLEATIHFEFQQFLEDLKTAYAPFDPDADTTPVWVVSAEERTRRADKLFDRFCEVLTWANFTRLSQADLERALEAMSEWGVNLVVDFSCFERLEVFARGAAILRRQRRRRFFFWPRRPPEVDVPIYQRLVVIFRLRERLASDEHGDPDTIYLKIFKNIPTMDLDMLLPGSRVRMSILDRGKVLLPIVSGLAIAVWKVVQGALVLLATGVYGALAFLGLLGGTVGYGLRSFHTHVRMVQRYQLNLTRSLYYQNMDNNAGVLHRLVDEAEEQELREAVLAWFFLWREAGPQGCSSEELDRRIEEFLARLIHREIDFEVSDALHKLQRLGLVEPLADGRVRALGLAAALARLDAAWDQLFRYAVETPRLPYSR